MKPIMGCFVYRQQDNYTGLSVWHHGETHNERFKALVFEGLEVAEFIVQAVLENGIVTLCPLRNKKSRVRDLIDF